MTGTSSSLSLLRKTRTDGRFDLPAAGVDKRISLLAVVPSTWRITGVTIWIAENRGCRVCAMPELPTGTVTFLFTDVQGSTRLWEQAPSQMMEALAQHDDVVERTVADHNGHIVKPRAKAIADSSSFPTQRMRSSQPSRYSGVSTMLRGRRHRRSSSGLLYTPALRN